MSGGGAPEKRIPIGVFGAPHGVRGEARLKSYAGEPGDFDRYGPLFDDEGRAYEIVGKRPVKDDLFVVRVKGVGDRDAAAALTGRALFVPRGRLPPPEPDEYYHADLIGLAAVAADGAAFGTVVAVLNYGAGDILEIAPAGGGETILLPFAEPFVGAIDFAAGRVTVAPPEEDAGEEG